MIELTSRNNVKLFRTPKQAYSYLNCTKSVFFKAIDRGKEINGHTITRTKKYLVIPDLHIPYHDGNAIDLIIKLKKNDKFDGIVFCGDVLDMTSLSSHNIGTRNPGQVLSAEYDAGEYWVGKISDCIKHKVFIWGNHENRYNRFMDKTESQKLGSAVLSPIEGLKLKEKGFEIIDSYPDGRFMLGDLIIMHGIDASVNAARSHLTKTWSNVMFGHTHRYGIFSEHGKVSYNIGSLVDRNADVFKYTSWTGRDNWFSSFAVVDVVSNKSYVNIVEIKDNTFIYNGRVYR